MRNYAAVLLTLTLVPIVHCPLSQRSECVAKCEDEYGLCLGLSFVVASTPTPAAPSSSTEGTISDLYGGFFSTASSFNLYTQRGGVILNGSALDGVDVDMFEFYVQSGGTSVPSTISLSKTGSATCTAHTGSKQTAASSDTSGLTGHGALSATEISISVTNEYVYVRCSGTAGQTFVVSGRSSATTAGTSAANPVTLTTSCLSFQNSCLRSCDKAY